MKCKNCKRILPQIDVSKIKFCPHCGIQNPSENITQNSKMPKPIRIILITLFSFLAFSSFIALLICIGVIITSAFSRSQEKSDALLVGLFLGLPSAGATTGLFFAIAKLTGDLKKTLKITAYVAGGLASVVAFGLLIGLLTHGGNITIISLTVVLSIILLVVLIYRLSKPDIISAFALLLGILMLVAVCIGSLNNFPEFIRKIPGKDFISKYFSFAGIVAAIVFVIAVIFCSLLSLYKYSKAKNKIFSDSDLMLLQNFDCYKMAGYYLLKGKVHNILKTKKVQPDEDCDEYSLVEINSELSEEKLFRLQVCLPVLRRCKVSELRAHRLILQSRPRLLYENRINQKRRDFSSSRRFLYRRLSLILSWILHIPSLKLQFFRESFFSHNSPHFVNI